MGKLSPAQPNSPAQPHNRTTPDLIFFSVFGHRPRPRGDRGAAGGPFPLPLGPLGTFGPAGDSGRRDLVVYPVVQGHPRPQLAPAQGIWTWLPPLSAPPRAHRQPPSKECVDGRAVFAHPKITRKRSLRKPAMAKRNSGASNYAVRCACVWRD